MNFKNLGKQLKAMTQKQRDDLLVQELEKLEKLDKQMIKTSIKHLEENGYKVTKL